MLHSPCKWQTVLYVLAAASCHISVDYLRTVNMSIIISINTEYVPQETDSSVQDLY